MSSSDIQVQYVTRASQFPSFARDVLEADPVKSNVILPTLNKCIAKERNGQTPNDHLWIVVYTSREVLFIASCTDGYMGKYPIFLFTPIPYSHLRRDTIVPALRLLAGTLHRHVPAVSRVYSVFGPEIVARTFCSLWTQRTGIPEVLEPYYLAKISFATVETLINRRLPTFPDEFTELRPASREDIPALSELCYLFAGESPPFDLEPVSAMQEANILVMNGEAWVYTVSRPGQPTRIASMVAFTRNTDRMATITKVYTHPDFRGQRRAERLVRRVCKQLLTSRRCVSLFVGVDNKAANVYRRVGFVGLDDNAPPVEGVDPWIEIGFDTNYVELGHW